MMGSVKNRVRNKLFRCFRPAAIDDDSIKQHATGPRKGKAGKISNSLSEEKGKVYSEGGDAGGGRSDKERSRRSFSTMAKAVMFDASLMKKPCNRKARRISNSPNINMPWEISQKVSKPSHDQEKRSKRKSSSVAGDWKKNYCNYWPSLDSSLSTIFSTHSSSSPRVSSITLDSTHSSEDKASFRTSSVKLKQIDRVVSIKNVREYSRVDVGLCIFLISFSVLIFWGRVCAIFCTSMLLLLFVGPGKRFGSGRRSVELPEVGLEEHKKKVIMEGLLQRNHSRLL